MKTHNVYANGIIGNTMPVRAFCIDDIYQNVKIDDILDFRDDKYKVSSISKFGIIAFKILNSGKISKSRYIQMSTSTLTEKTKKQ